jgi:Protein of unknown function (DUF997)
MPAKQDDPVLRTSRREATVVLAIWLTVMSYTVGTCWWRGYGRDWETVTFVFGFPDWVFWGIICPWLSCVALAWWFAYRFMSDQSLGEEDAANASQEP